MLTFERRQCVEDYTQHMEETKPFRFKDNWTVKFPCLFGGAVFRMVVSDGDVSISVYYDCWHALGGGMEGFYWEAYADDAEHPVRFTEQEELQQYLEKVLN